MKRLKQRTDYILDRIRGKYPEIQDVDVAITETSDDAVKTTISLKRFGHHFAAVKRASTSNQSLHLALRAIERQIARVKNKERANVGRFSLRHAEEM